MTRWMIRTAVLAAFAGPTLAQDNDTRPIDSRPVEVRADEIVLDPAPAAPRPLTLTARGNVVIAQAPAAGLPPAPKAAPAPPAPAAGLPPAAGNAVRVQAQPGKREKVTYLGAQTTPAPAAMRDQLKLPQGVGLVVERVEPDSPAAKAALKPHDVLDRLDDQLLVNPEQFAALLRSRKPGDEVTLSIIRQGEHQTANAKLEEKEVETNTLRLMGGGGMGGFQPNAGAITLTPPPAPVDPARPGGADAVWEFGVGGGGAGVAGPGARRMMVRTLDDGRQTTVWADDEVSISLERAGGQTNKLTITDRKTNKTLYAGAPDKAKEMLDARPELLDKLKKAEAAAGRDNARFQAPAVFGRGGFAAAGGVGGGRVVRWQDDDHILILRVAGRSPTYLLALSKKDGRTVFDGPVANEDDRRSVPAEIAEEFQMIVNQPDAAQELGAPGAAPKTATPPTPAK